MITMYFLRMWGRCFLGLLLVLLIERVALGFTGWFILAGLATVAGFAGLTRLIWGDWKSTRNSGSGYRYDFIRDVTKR